MKEEKGPSLIIALAKKKALGKDKEDDGSDSVSIAEEMLKAIKDEDAEGLAQALESFIEVVS